MRCNCFILCLLLVAALRVNAQKPFTEGVVEYKVKLLSTDHKEYKGTYSFTFKGGLFKKELKLSNGYQDQVIYNCSAGTVYSLQNRDGKKYAIQLSMEEYVHGQQKFTGFVMKNEQRSKKDIAGQAVYKGDISYTDGSSNDIYYTTDWYPSQAITFERFPDAKFFPLIFSYKDEMGMVMEFEATKIEAGPVENAMFRIPPDYKMISYKEYKELSK